MPLEENGILKAALAGSSCGHSSAITLPNTLFEPREAKPRLRGETFYAALPNILFEPREAEPPLGGEAFYAG